VNSFLSLSTDQHLRMFRCSNCEGALKATDQFCPLCLTPFDHSAEASGELACKIDQASREAREMARIPGVLWASFRALRWWLRFGSLRSNSLELIQAKRSVRRIAIIWTATSLLIIVCCVCSLYLFDRAEETDRFESALSSGDTAQALSILRSHRELATHEFGNGESPLMLAAEMGDKQLVALLLADGANVDSIDSVGNTPLHWAATGGNLEVAELMIARKLNVDVKNNAGQTPLHLAIKGPDPPLNRGRHQYCSVVNMLLANHADINAQDDEGRTPLHYSIRFGALARLLLKKGSDPSIRDRSGETPLDLAESKFSRGRVRYYDPQKVDPAVPYLLGVPDDGAIPVSRYGADPACN
jgi:hypothetical protein